VLNSGQKLYTKLRHEVAETGVFAPDWNHLFRRLTLYGTLHILSYLGLFFCANSGWRWAAIIGLTISNLQFYFLSHDAGHYSLSRHRKVNLWLGEIGDTFIAGGSFRFWQYKHNLHHRYCNDEALDPDMKGDFIKFYVDDPTERPAWIRWMVRQQSYLLWVLAMFHNFEFQRISWLYMLKNPKQCRIEFLLVPLHFVVYLLIPIAVLGWPMALVNYVVVTMISGLILAKLFAVNHIGMPSVSGEHGLSFIEQQVVTSRNVIIPRWLDDYFGGLNYQIEHHLFPWIPISRYRQISPLVKSFCQQHAIAYVEEDLLTSLRSVTRHLDRVGQTEL
jgi:fatty acid desaturase